MDAMFATFAGALMLFGVTVDLNAAAVLAFIGALVAAYPTWRLIGANRRKVLAEAGALANTAADERIKKAAELFAADNERLRGEMRDMRTAHAEEITEMKTETAELRGHVTALELRCEQLTRVLIENGLPVPPKAEAV